MSDAKGGDAGGGEGRDPPAPVTPTDGRAGDGAQPPPPEGQAPPKRKFKPILVSDQEYKKCNTRSEVAKPVVQCSYAAAATSGQPGYTPWQKS